MVKQKKDNTFNNEAPVLLITFNRADNARKVFEQIRKAKVKRLYIANDAPRNGNIDDEKAREDIKKMVAEVDWDCELYTKFQSQNLGCGYGVSGAISWAFENEDRLIILEDDCVPSQPFFKYCNEMLEKYKDNDDIGLVSGRSHHSNHKVFNHTDYIFTMYGHIWGWATWKRVWKNYDIKMTGIDTYLRDGGFVNVFSSNKEKEYFNNLYKKLSRKKDLDKSTWDFQYNFQRFKNKQLSIVSKKNLIHNIGNVGVHSTSDVTNKAYTLKAEESFSVKKHPQEIRLSADYEKFHFENHINPQKKPFLIRISNKIQKKILKLIK